MGPTLTYNLHFLYVMLGNRWFPINMFSKTVIVFSNPKLSWILVLVTLNSFSCWPRIGLIWEISVRTSDHYASFFGARLFEAITKTHNNDLSNSSKISGTLKTQKQVSNISRMHTHMKTIVFQQFQDSGGKKETLISKISRIRDTSFWTVFHMISTLELNYWTIN